MPQPGQTTQWQWFTCPAGRSAGVAMAACLAARLVCQLVLAQVAEVALAVAGVGAVVARRPHALVDGYRAPQRLAAPSLGSDRRT
jgi:hypothetical protein